MLKKSSVFLLSILLVPIVCFGCCASLDFERMSMQDIGISDPTIHWERIPPLCRAACNGDSRTVLELLDRATWVDAYDDVSKRTALHWAVFGKCFVAAETMVSYSGKGYISFDSDVLFLDANTLRILLKRGASYNQDNFVLLALFKGGADVHAVDKYGRTALHYAVIGNNYEAVDILLAHGASVNAMDGRGHTPLYYGLCFADKRIQQALSSYDAREQRSDA